MTVSSFPANGAIPARKRLLAPLLLAIAASVPCWPVIFGGRTFYFRDVHLFLLPQRALVAELIRQGHLPLWDPFMHGGSPLWANPDNLTTHPTTLLYVVLPTALAFGLDTVICLLLAALGGYALARRLDLSLPASVVTGAVFSLSGVMLSLVSLHPLLLTLTPLAAMLWAWHGWLSGGSRRWLCVVTALAAACAVGGGAEAALAGIALTFAWTLAAPGSRSLLQRVVALAGCGAGALAITAPAWLPAIGVIGHSTRGAGFPWAQATSWSLHPARLPEILVPGIMGRSDTLDVADHWGLALEGMFSSYFLSISLGPLAVALIATGCSRSSPLPRRLRFVLMAFATLAVALALGRYLPGSSLLEGWRPPMRFPVKFLLFGCLPAALLAGAGLDCALDGDAARRRKFGISLGVLAGSLAMIGVIPHLAPGIARAAATAWFGVGDAVTLRGVSGALLAAALEAAIGTAIVLLLRGDAIARFRRGLMAAAVVGGLLHAARPVNPTAPRIAMEGEPVLATIARATSRGDRLFRDRNEGSVRISGDSNDAIHGARWNLETLRYYTASRYGLPVVFHVDPDGLAPERMSVLSRTLDSVDWPQRLPLLSSAGVRTIVTSQSLTMPEVVEVGSIDIGNGSRMRVHELSPAAPARFVPRVRLVPDDAAAIAAVTDPAHDPKEEVVVVGAGRPPGNDGCSGLVEPASLSLRPPQDLVVDAGCPGFVVLAVPHQPGIEIEVDGALQQVIPADVAFCAVPVREGRHAVRWRYRLKVLPAAFAICAAGLVGLLVAACLPSRMPHAESGMSRSG